MKSDLSSTNNNSFNNVDYKIGVVKDGKFYESSIPFSNLSCIPHDLWEDPMNVGYARRPLDLTGYDDNTILVSTDNMDKSEVVEVVSPHLNDVVKDMFNGACNQL